MEERSYFVYIVASRSRNLYVGITGRLIPRIHEHRTGAYEGYSQTYRCSRLVYYERYQYVNEANRAREAVEAMASRQEALVD